MAVMMEIDRSALVALVRDGRGSAVALSHTLKAGRREVSAALQRLRRRGWAEHDVVWAATPAGRLHAAVFMTATAASN